MKPSESKESNLCSFKRQDLSLTDQTNKANLLTPPKKTVQLADKFFTENKINGNNTLFKCKVFDKKLFRRVIQFESAQKLTGTLLSASNPSATFNNFSQNGALRLQLQLKENYTHLTSHFMDYLIENFFPQKLKKAIVTSNTKKMILKYLKTTGAS